MSVFGSPAGVASRRRAAVAAAWIAFVARGVLQVLWTPAWDGFDEPFHVAYVEFVADHGRPPGFAEPSFPADYYEALPLLPSAIGHGAVDFREWRALGPDERAARRARAAAIGAGRIRGERPYRHANYERQQPPLFYYVAAPFARLLRGAGIAGLLIGLRILCVLFASLTVPLTARLARLLLPGRGVFYALPVFCLLPNTLFFTDRVTNDALAWPLLASIGVALVLASRRPGSPRRFLLLGLLVAAGIWTKLTLLPALPAALVAVLLARRRRDGRRPGAFLLAVALPALLVAPLLLWNRTASGSWTGIIYSVRAPWVGLSEEIGAAGKLDLPGAFGQWARSHFWAGGWGWVVPPPAVYRAAGWLAVAALLAGFVSARARRARLSRGVRWIALLSLAVFFLAAMLWHLVEATAVARALGTGPLGGGEGWYFDLLRPIEACAAAALLGAAIPARRTRFGAAALVLLLVAVDGAGTLGLLFPHWAGLERLESTGAGIREAIRGARAAAAIPPSAPVSASLLVLVAGAWARFLRLAGAGSVRRA